MTKSHAVIILASGLSQRLGQSKQLLKKYGEPLIGHMTRLALTTQPQAIVLVIPQDQPAITDATFELVSQHPMIYPVANPMPETGMAHSLNLGIAALTNINSIFDTTSHNQVLIMGVDQVLLDSRHLTHLLAGKHSVTASSYDRVSDNYLNEQLLNKPRLDGTDSTDEPKENIVGLPIVISYELLKQWQSVLTGDKGLRHLIRALPTNQIDTVINHQLIHDIDTPEQLSYAKRQRWLDN